MKNKTDFWVGDRFVRPSLGEIQLGPERVHLEPRSMEVLLALVERAPEVVPKQELIDAVWGEAFVSDEVLTHAIWDLRRAFGDNASDPEFIQTIPKKGYRLIAPIKPIEPHRRRATDRGRARSSRRPFLRRWPIWGLVAIAVLLPAGFWLVPDGPPADVAPAVSPKTVLLMTLSQADGPANWGQRLEARLGRELVGADLEVLPADSCEATTGTRVDYCLETKLLHGTDGYEAIARLLKRAGGGLAYSASLRVESSGTDLEEAAAELGEMIHTYLQVTEDPFFGDPDLEPWISLQDHDIRAIRDFLLGAAYVYRHETGGRHAMATAIAHDSDFVAPKVWRTPSLVNEADAETLSRHRRELDRLYLGANAFEKAMIKWATALIDGNLVQQIQQLRVALERVEENRPIRLALGATLAGQGDAEEAWRQIEPLVGQNWHYPGLYPLAALIAIQRDRIDDIREALDLALKVETVDPEALAVLVVLAIYDEDTKVEELYTRRLALRRREMAAEDIDNEYVSVVASSLAARAGEEGREETATRLRESVY